MHFLFYGYDEIKLTEYIRFSNLKLSYYYSYEGILKVWNVRTLLGIFQCRCPVGFANIKVSNY